MNDQHLYHTLCLENFRALHMIYGKLAGWDTYAVDCISKMKLSSTNGNLLTYIPLKYKVLKMEIGELFIDVIVTTSKIHVPK